MKLSVIQPSIRIGNINRNKQTVLSLIEKALSDKPDTILLPELWPTGFYPKNIIDYAITEESALLQEISNLAARHNINIVAGTIATKKQDNVFNTCYCFSRQGKLITKYDKLHLFSPAGENKDFTPGNQLITFSLDGVKCGVVICYDIRFPELIRQLALEDINILFVPAAWPAIRQQHWDTLLKARAIENQLFVAGANSITPNDCKDVPLGGHSVIINPWGEVLAQGSENGDSIITANIDLAIIRNIRQSINVFRDRRTDLYN